QSLADPSGLIHSGQSRQHKVCVDDKAYGLTFVADWNRVAPGGVSLTLVSPKGEVITPTTSGISYFSDQMFAQYVIRGDRVRGGAGAGEWTMNLTGTSAIPSNSETQYSYAAMEQTGIHVAAKHFGDHFTGGAAGIFEVTLNAGGTPVVPTTPGGVTPTPTPGPVPVAADQESVVTVHFDMPAASYSTYLATSKVEREWFPEPGTQPQVKKTGSRFSFVRPLFAQTRDSGARTVPPTIMGEATTIPQRKAWALRNIANRPYEDKRTTGSLQLYDDGTHGDRIAR